MNQKILKIITVLMLVITLTMANFVLLCADVVTYAADTINADKSTNNKNVEFTTYLKNDKGEKVNSLDAKINAEDLKLYFQITVKQEGLFNGDIVLNDANFKFKTDFTDNSISKIEENKIYLNQINAGETKEIEVGIQLLTDSQFDLGLISKENKIAIEGTYKDSTQKDIAISAKKTLKINMVSPYANAEECINLEQKVITNKVAKYNGEDKRIIQVQVNSGITNNLVPIKSSTIKAQAPKISNKYPEVLVNSNKTLATNGKVLAQDNWNYNKETGLTTIEINNTAENNKITWVKNGDDQFIITYIFDKDVEINNDKISTSSEISLYENKSTVVNASAESQISKEEKDSMLTTEISKNETSIYKGKLYSGISRDITYTTTINANISGVIDSTTINEEELKIGDKEIASTYKNTVISKQNVIDVLGDKGELKILNSSNNAEIARVNTDSQVDENGNVVVNYEAGVSGITITTTEPQKVGSIKITSTKTIEKIEKTIVKSATEITTKVTGETLEDTNKVVIPETVSTIGLQETETKAQLQLNKTELSTMSTNNVEMRVVLDSRDENNDLYSNPTVRIQLPEKCQEVTVNSVQLLDENELKIASQKLVDGNTLEIKLNGTQTSYKDKAIEGATLILNMSITLDKKLPSSQEQITLTCVNGDKTAQDTKNVNFVSYAGLVTINRLEDYGLEVINNQGEKEVTIPIKQMARTSNTTRVENEIINNEENEITNVNILGTFPTKDAVEGNNFDISAGEISIQGIDASRAKIYYSENANATKDLTSKDNGWTENISDAKKVKKYLIIIDKLAVRENAKIAYNIQLPQNLDYNLTAKQGYTVYYTNVTTEKQVTADFMVMNTEKGANLDVALKTLVGNKEVTTAKEGEIIRYVVSITNTYSEDITNATITSTIPEGTVLVDTNKLNSTEQIEDESEEEEDDNIELSQKDISFSVDKIAKGQTISKYYDVKVKAGTAGKTLKHSVQLQYGDVTKTSNEVNTTIESGSVSVELRNTENETVKNGYGYRYILTVRNITNKKINNLVATINTPEGIEVSELFYSTDDGVEKAEKTNKITIKELGAGESLKIAVYTVVEMKTDNEKENVIFNATVTDGNKEYNSNALYLILKNESKGLEMTVTSDNNNEYVETGDKITYNVVVKNNSANNLKNVNINNVLSKSVSLESVTRNGKDLTEDDYEVEKDDDTAQKTVKLTEDEIPSGETITYSLETEVVPVDENDEVEQIVNETYLRYAAQNVKTAKVEHILKNNNDSNNSSDNNNNNGDNNNGNNNSNGNSSSESSTYMISGTAWIDENENGQKDATEKLLEGIKVKLLDATTNEYAKDSNGNTIETTTNSEGFYAFTKVLKGQYLVVFEYDTTAYKATGYEVSGAEQGNTSKAIEKTLTIDGKEEKVGVTEKIDLTENIASVNIGLVQAKKYDMQLDKYVTKVTVQNSKTTSTDYTDAKLAKQEINAKEVNSTTVVVEYTIRVTNNGEVPGYIKKIADYLSSDYKFSSELNKDWYQDGSNVYCTSLADTKINPGESKDVKLTVIKQMKENNTGLVNNTAEIVSSYNELGLTDINSTEGNKVKGENDMSSADVIISIKTGQVITTVVLVITTIIMLGVAVYIVRKIIINKEIM